MGNRSRPIKRLLFVSLILLTAALAGCAGQEGVPGDGNGSAGDGDPSELTDEQARSSYQDALKVLSEGPTDVSRVGITMSVEAADASADTNGTMTSLFDEDQSLMIMSMEGEAFAQTSTEGGFRTGAGGPPSSFLFAQVHKTSFFGAPPEVIGSYDANQTPPDSFGDVDAQPPTLGGGFEQPDSASLGDPATFMGALGQGLPQGAEVTHGTTTYEGQTVLEVTSTYEENGTTFEVRALIDQANNRAVLIETHVTNPSAEDAVERDGRFTMTFTYGSDATHEHEEALIRLESMTLSSDAFSQDMMMGMDQQDSSEQNWTIQPSQNPGMVPLDEVQVHVTPGAQSQSTEPVLTLDAENGMAENADVIVTYNDEDGDGAVSPGDTITLQNKTEQGSQYSVAIHDEETGMTLVPSPGLLALVGVLGLAAIATRRQR